MKIGDKVRFLNEIGGGIVKGFQGKDIVLVEDADGFDIPMAVRECVVIDTDNYNMVRRRRNLLRKKRKRVRQGLQVLFRKRRNRGTWLRLNLLSTASRRCVAEMC